MENNSCLEVKPLVPNPGCGPTEYMSLGESHSLSERLFYHPQEYIKNTVLHKEPSIK